MTIEVEAQGAVTIVTIDRPEVRNAVDGPTADALAQAFRSFGGDDDQLVAVLTGAGGTFCAGADLKAMANDPGRANRIDPEGDGPMGPTRMVLDKPVIAAIEGHAVAGGMELLLWCDLRVAAENATFGFYDRRWGVPLVDGGTVRLPRLIGQSRALDMILTGRPVSGTEAFEMGLVNRLTRPGEALAQAIALAEEIARFPQTVMRADRRSTFEQWGLPLDRAMAQEFSWGIDAAATGETQTGAERFASGRGRHGSFEDI
ncbi:MAG TPA: crotonase/enoyl-CoA hydratase family protein [Actinomycetota bacterium]|nr:crotonase/enoyl-CoA hydratase family protein [Actinomycetota bacterium]